MYGLILVEPEKGLPRGGPRVLRDARRVLHQGRTMASGHQPFDMAKAREEPEYVVFNGGWAPVPTTRALTAKVGETVRLFVGNGGPNLISSFHVIGEIFDRVWPEGGAPRRAAAQRADHAHPGGRRRDRGVQGRGPRPVPARRPQHLARDGQGRARESWRWRAPSSPASSRRWSRAPTGRAGTRTPAAHLSPPSPLARGRGSTGDR